MLCFLNLKQLDFMHKKAAEEAAFRNILKNLWLNLRRLHRFLSTRKFP